MPTTWMPPSPIELKGRFVTLRAHVPERDVAVLYFGSHGTPEKEAIWNYLPYGPFGSQEEMGTYYSENMTGKADPMVWTVFSNEGRSRSGRLRYWQQSRRMGGRRSGMCGSRRLSNGQRRIRNPNICC